MKDCSKSLENRIKEQVELLRRITRSIHYDFYTVTFQQTGQERLSSASGELRRLMDQKAAIDSHLLEGE